MGCTRSRCSDSVLRSDVLIGCSDGQSTCLVLRWTVCMSLFYLLKRLFIRSSVFLINGAGFFSSVRRTRKAISSIFRLGSERLAEKDFERFGRLEIGRFATYFWQQGHCSMTKRSTSRPWSRWPTCAEGLRTWCRSPPELVWRLSAVSG